jgi:hypothetical protein
MGGRTMFMALAGAGLFLIGWWAERKSDEDRRRRPDSFDDNEVRQSVVHTRQDVRLIALLLGGIILMLGLIADVLSGK